MNSDWTLKEISARIKGTLYGRGEGIITQLAIDSRTAVSEQGTLFIALVGEQHDGHQYIGELYERGFRSFLVSQYPPRADGKYPEASFCLVENSLEGLQAMAFVWREKFNGEVLAITGSNGKTIVKEWLHQCLSGHIPTYRSPLSFNSQVGVPLSLWGISSEHKLAIIEAGISFPGEMERLQAIIQPDTGIFTNLGSAHQEHFTSLKEKAREKAKLFAGCKKVICRADLSIEGSPIQDFLDTQKTEIVDWSLGGEARYVFQLIEKGQTQSRLLTSLDGRELNFSLPFGDDASIENALHVFVYAAERGFTEEQLKKGMLALEPVSMRLQMLQGIMDSILINDSYNSDTGGLAAALDLMSQQASHKKRVVILSDLLQSGREEKDLYQEISKLLESKGVGQFIAIGPALGRQAALFPPTARFYDNTLEFLNGMDRTLFRDCVVLVKGSRKFGFERITRELQLKSHQTRLEINMNALVHNLNHFRSLLHTGVETMVMVKALSYGIGNIEIARLMQFHKTDSLAVAFIDEGMELRSAGIHLPIMVLNPDPSGIASLIDHRLEPEVYSISLLKVLQKNLRLRGISSFPIHLKLDTGMHRLGLGEEELDEAIPWLLLPEFRLASVFTHLAASNQREHDSFTRSQVAQYDRMCHKLKDQLGSDFKQHVLNSAGIEQFRDLQYDMVRLGIGLHGIGTSDSLKVVSSFLTIVSQVRTVGAGETVGYSRRGLTKKISRIATIPVGYADGFNRKLGNGVGQVIIQGKKFPTIGEVCMDMTMIDVSQANISEGALVEIFGKDQSLSELARQAGTIPYDILTSIPGRVKRVYLQE